MYGLRLSARFIVCAFCTLSVAGQAQIRAGERPSPSISLHETLVNPAVATVDVDGSLTPDQIPDDVAYFHFFQTLSRHPSTDPSSDDRRRRAYLQNFFNRQCGSGSKDLPLTEDQIQRLLALADDFSAKLSEIRAGTSGISRRDLATGSAAALDSVLDPGAVARVRAHVMQHVKQRIKLVTPKPPAANK